MNKVSLKEVILNGKFDCVKIGDSKEWINNNIGEPDDTTKHKKLSIWRYNGIEFHCREEELYLIYCDYLKDIYQTSKIEIDMCIFSSEANLNIMNIIEMLLNEQISFKVIHDKELSIIKIVIDQSGVELQFEEIEQLSKKYYLNSFGLK